MLDREIKFRGIRSDTKQWVCGGLDDTTIFDHSSVCHSAYEVEYETIGQFTGINDESISEKEIYENDIVKFVYNNEKYVGVVKFQAGMFILVNNKLPDSYIPMNSIINNDRNFWWVDGRVIGNIFENSDLLKEDSPC